MSDHNTFRELFDQAEREEIVAAMLERTGRLQGRITRLKNGERVTDATTKLDEMEARYDWMKAILDRLVDETI